jgi:hypothetical protein
MKQKVAFAIALFCALVPLSAEIALGGSLGYSLTIDASANSLKDKDYSVTLSAFPIQGEIGWVSPFSSKEVPFKDASKTFGLRIGTQEVEAIVPSDTVKASMDPWDEMKLETIPIRAFARLETGYAFADIGLGLHFWKLERATDKSTESDDLDRSGSDVTWSLSAGPRILLLKRLDLRVGPFIDFYAIPNFGDGQSANSLVIGAALAASVWL